MFLFQSSQTICLTAAGLWLFNPLSCTVSVRGNAESVMSFLVLMCLKFLMDGQIIAAGLLYALSIHFKIYPVTYALAIYLYLGDSGCHRNKDSRGEGHHHGKILRTTSEGRRHDNRLRQTVLFLVPNRDRLVFGLSAAVVLTGLTGLFYMQ